MLKEFYHLISGRRRSMLLSMFLPTFLFGDIFDADAASQRTYRPTQAQRRLEAQRRLQNQRIAEIRRQNAARNAAKAAAAAKTAAATKAAEAAPKLRYTWIKSQRYILLGDIAKFYGLSLVYTKTGAVLRGAAKVDLYYNKRLASIDGVTVYFTAPPVLRGNNAYLNEKDLLLVLDPVLRGKALAKYPVRTIMIDPGHGGTDKGAAGAGGRLLEKNLNLSMALKLRTALRKLGFQVIMTRGADSTLSLQGRAELCKKYKPDLFISIHCNAAAQKTISGIETFAMTPNGCASSNDSKPGNSTGTGNSFDKNNYRMAYEIQKALLKNTKAEDRGVKHARFFVLRNASCPAVLIETGFISNLRESALLNRADYQAKIVNAIVTGILNYRASYR